MNELIEQRMETRLLQLPLIIFTFTLSYSLDIL